MKTGIHPEYKETRVQCACGNSFMTKSTKFPKIKIEICAQCHPFFTGQKRLLDTTGRVEKFRAKYGSNY